MLDLRFVRVIRLARILRALRSERFGNMGSVIADILKHSAAALAIPIYFMMLALVRERRFRFRFMNPLCSHEALAARSSIPSRCCWCRCYSLVWCTMQRRAMKCTGAALRGSSPASQRTCQQPRCQTHPKWWDHKACGEKTGKKCWTRRCSRARQPATHVRSMCGQMRHSRARYCTTNCMMVIEKK